MFDGMSLELTKSPISLIYVCELSVCTNGNYLSYFIIVPLSLYAISTSKYVVRGPFSHDRKFSYRYIFT